MGLICLWRRPQLIRCLLISRPIDEDPGLKRHVDRCRGCSEALRDYQCFDSVLKSHAPYELSSEFNAGLARRIATAVSLAPNERAGARTGLRAVSGLQLAAGLACVGGLILWACASIGRSERPETESDKGRIVWVKSPPHPAEKSNTKLAGRNQRPPSVGSGLVEPPKSPSLERLTVRRLHHRGRSMAKRSMRIHRLYDVHLRPDAPVDLQADGSAVGARELFISLVAPPWHETADAYAQIGDEPAARDAYAREYERDGNVEAAIRAGEFSAAAGDPASELQYCAFALTANR